MSLVKTTHPDFALDQGSGALVNTNQDAFASFQAKRMQLREQRELISRLDRAERLLTELTQRVQELEAK